jgi:hypothetical protein
MSLESAAREVAMISFFCVNCGLKLQVKDEFAGRSSKCPTCKQPLVAPAPDKTLADVAVGPMDGTDSSLAKVGFDGGVTLQATARAARSPSRSCCPTGPRQTVAT